MQASLHWLHGFVCALGAIVFLRLAEVCMCMLVAQSCLTLCGPMDYSLPGSSAHGIFQAGILEPVAIPFSRGSSRPRDRTQVSCVAGGSFTSWVTIEIKCTISVMHLNHPWINSLPLTLSMEKLSSKKLIPGAKKVKDRCYKGTWCTVSTLTRFGFSVCIYLSSPYTSRSYKI